MSLQDKASEVWSDSRAGLQRMVADVRETYREAGQWDMWLRMHREYVNLARLYEHTEESLLDVFIQLKEQGRLARFARRELEARRQAEMVSVDPTEQ